MRPSDWGRLLLLAAIWGAAFLFMRIVAPVLGALPTAFLRVLIAALGLIVILAVMQQAWRFEGRVRHVLLLGAINSGIPFAMYTYAAKSLPAGYSAILNACTPMMGVLIGAAFFGERVTAAKLGGVALGLLGVAVLTGAGPVAPTPAVLLAASACLLATACYGLAGFLTRRWAQGIDSKVVALGSQFGATLLLAPQFATVMFMAPIEPSRWQSGPVWLALAALGLVCTALAYLLYFRLIKDIGPVKSLTVTFLIPPFGVLWGVLFLGEHLNWAHAGGGALIGAALWLILRPAPTALPTSGSAR
jgi:drug/metabolite transporter (DMT)-like permease